MSEFRIRAKVSAVFVRPIEEFKDGVMKGEVRSAGKNAVNHFWIGDIVIYLLDDTLTEFTEPGSGQKNSIPAARHRFPVRAGKRQDWIRVGPYGQSGYPLGIPLTWFCIRP